ncbi:MAG: rhodanese-like domain-containing protein, partial [Pseudomonadales bacterium]
MHKISPLDLKDVLLGEEEFALIDVREQGAFSESHLLFAVCVPLSRLELLIGDLVPRKDARLVVVDDSASDGLGGRAVHRLGELGYTNVILLEGGIAAWRSAGQELFSGVNV